MVDTVTQERYRNDARALAGLGVHLAKTNLPDIEVRLPKALADVAKVAGAGLEPATPRIHAPRYSRILVGVPGSRIPMIHWVFGVA